MWQDGKVLNFSHATIRRLIDARISAVRLCNFATQTEMVDLKGGLLKCARRTRTIREITRLGISQYEQSLRGAETLHFGTMHA